ncbi:MAG: tail fiber domain-containing protein [Acidobacteriota bacterium]
MRHQLGSVTLIISLVLLATAVFLPEVGAAPYSVEAVSLGTGAAFSTDFVFAKASLTVSGPDGYLADSEVLAGEPLAFTLPDAAADGLYKWQLIVLGSDGGSRSGLEVNAERPNRSLSERAPASHRFTGTFRVTGGVVEFPSEPIGTGDRDLALKADIVEDDLIVKGSQCLGGNCTDSEAFGFDTLRLRENNLRIYFDDTSSTASFPSNDWQIVANSSNNNGLSFLGIEDATAGNYPFRIEAGAGADALYVEDGGGVGIGTSNPERQLHVQNGDGPAVRLYQDTSSGYTKQIWDIEANEANFFIRDATHNAQLPLRIKADAGDDRMVLTSNGIGFGFDNPKAPLHIKGGGSAHNPSNDAVMALFQNNSAETDGSIIAILAGNGSANAQMWFGDSDNDKAGRIIYRNGSDALSFWTAGTERFFIESGGDICIGCNDAQGDALRHSNGAHLTSGGTWTNASSRSLKQDIADLSTADAENALDGLSPVTFRYSAELGETYVGFIAEDVPELVAMGDRRSLTSMDIVAVLTKVVQEQRKAAVARGAELELQRAELEALRARLEALEQVD